MSLLRRIPPARWLNWLLLASMIWTVSNLKHWNKEGRLIVHDVVYYYSYLPSTFIHDDPSLAFTDADPEYWRGKAVAINDDQQGPRVIKMSAGLATLWSPFFMAGHLMASSQDDVLADGYSWPYRLMISVACLLYLSIGLYYLRKILSEHFSMWVTSLTLLAVVAGTQLFYYSTIEAGMSHSYTFALVAAWFWFLNRWLQEGGLKLVPVVGLLFGLIILIRPANVVLVIFYVLWMVKNGSDLKARLQWLWQRKFPLLLMVLCALVVWIPQVLYYKAVSGQWLYWSYAGEGFYFTQPEILKGLFSFHKGWLIYTPIMFFALVGIGLCWKYKKEWFWSLSVFLVLFIYLTFSWWCWWYGGSFGQRPFIDHYALLALPLALALKHLLQARIHVKVLGITAFTFFIALNLFQTRQYYGGKTLHWDSMTREAYFATFFKLDPPENFGSMLRRPDYDVRRTTGETIYVDPNMSTSE